MHLARDPEPPEDRFLVWLVGNAETGLQIDPLSKLAQQLGAECVDRTALHALYPLAQLVLQALGDLAGGFVGEGENADPGGIDGELLDQISDALDEAERLAGAGPGENEKGLRRGLDRGALARGGGV